MVGPIHIDLPSPTNIPRIILPLRRCRAQAGVWHTSWLVCLKRRCNRLMEMVLKYRVKRTVFTPAWPWQMQLSTGYQWPEHRHWTQSAAALEVFQWSNNHNTLLDFLVNCTFSRLLLLLEWYCTHMWKLPCKLSARIIIELWITFTSSEPQLLHSSCNQKAKNNTRLHELNSQAAADPPFTYIKWLVGDPCVWPVRHKLLYLIHKCFHGRCTREVQ